MADQVKFLRGTQASLTAKLTAIANGTGTVEKGAFYLTSDTDRLYFAQETNELVPLNQFIRSVADVAALSNITAADGDYYYCKADNVLAVWDANEGTNGGWVQLNPDTNNRINNSSTALTSGAGTQSGEVKINLNVTDDGIGNDQRAATGSVTLKPSGAVSLTQSNNEITIGVAEGVDTTYQIGTAAASSLNTGETGAKVTLDASGAATDTDITIKSADNKLAVSQSGGVITLTAADQGVSAVSANFDSSGNFKVGVKDELDADYTFSTQIAPEIVYGENGSQSEKFESGTATLNVYTTSEVDSKISAAMATADALTYAGTVSSTDAATKLTTDKPVGTVYKASTDIANPQAKTGDLIIAEKVSGTTEGETGSVTWVVIPSGDDQTITWSHNTSTGQVGSTDGTDGSYIKVAAGTHMAVSHDDNNGSQVLTTTVAQAADYTAQSASGSVVALTADQVGTGKTGSITAVTGLTSDVYGNVTGVTTGTLEVKDTHANIAAVQTSAAVSNVDGVPTSTITTTVSDSDAQQAQGTFGIASDNLTLTASGATTKINLEWGTF